MSTCVCTGLLCSLPGAEVCVSVCPVAVTIQHKHLINTQCCHTWACKWEGFVRMTKSIKKVPSTVERFQTDQPIANFSANFISPSEQYSNIMAAEMTGEAIGYRWYGFNWCSCTWWNLYCISTIFSRIKHKCTYQLDKIGRLASRGKHWICGNGNSWQISPLCNLLESKLCHQTVDLVTLFLRSWLSPLAINILNLCYQKSITFFVSGFLWVEWFYCDFADHQ